MLRLINNFYIFVVVLIKKENGMKLLLVLSMMITSYVFTQEKPLAMYKANGGNLENVGVGYFTVESKNIKIDVNEKKLDLTSKKEKNLGEGIICYHIADNKHLIESVIKSNRFVYIFYKR